MRAGLLRHRVTIQSRGTGQDDYGGQVTTWTDLATVDAEVKPLSGKELVAAQAVQSVVTHQVCMRYRADVTAQTRLLYRGRILNILAAPSVDERDRELQLICSEGLTNG